MRVVAPARARRRPVTAAQSAGAPPPSPAPERPGGSGGVPELLRRATEEAAGLLGADGAFLYLLDQATGRLRLTHSAGVDEIGRQAWVHTLELAPGEGMFGRSVEQRKVLVTGDYPADTSFVHAQGPDLIVSQASIQSMVVAPLVAGDEVFGALGTFSRGRDAFTGPQVALVRALADHAAIAMANARLIDELDSSRAALARQAEVERALRELGTRISGARDPEAVVQFTIDEALRLLDGDGARIDIVDADLGLLRGMYQSGDEEIAATEWPDDPDDRLEVGASGRAVVTGETYVTGDYLSDTTIVHGTGPDTYARSKGIASVIATPLFGDHGPFGALTVWSTRRDAFGPEHGTLLETIAGQGAVALGRARLIEELGRSRETLARRAEEERTLREIARRLMTIQDPAELLQDVVAEAARLLGSSGAVIDLLDPVTGEARWAHDAGIDDATRDEWQRRAAGVDGVVLAIRERRVIVTDDYAADPRFPDGEVNRAFLERAGIRSIAFAPMVGEAVVLGTLAVFAGEAGRFRDQDAALLGALADLATIAIHNAELIAELASSREETARRAETERTLREIAARVTAIRDPEAILGLIVDEARRVLGSDGAHLTRMSDDGTFLRPVVITGEMNDDTRAWLRSQRFPIDGGINGLAAGQGRVVWSPNYATDPRIPREEDDLQVAERMGLGAMAAAPLRAPGGEVIGTLAISYRAPGPIAADRLATLQALADHAAIALSNSDLMARLGASESSYRRLVQATPDVIWRNDAEGRFTFIAEGAEAMFGWRADELVGQHFSFIVAPESMPDAGRAWEVLAATPDASWRLPFVFRRRDGSTFPAEVSAVTSFDDGAFAGAQGTLRDVSERERLERELRSSEERYRGLVQSSPDLIFEMDGNGVYTFYSDRTEEVIGWQPGEMIGRPFTDFVDMTAFPDAPLRLAEIAGNPGRPFTDRLVIRHRDGTPIPFEVSVVGQADDDGALIAIRGIARDISLRERLERELRASEERYRFLVENSPDVVFSVDAEGQFTYVSESIVRLTGFNSAELVGRPFSEIVTPDTIPIAVERWTSPTNEPGQAHVLRLELRCKDGTSVPVEVHSVGVPDSDDRFAGVHGSARDIGERERLEAELRASEERHRSVIQSSPDLIWATNRAGRYVFVSDRVRDLLGWEPEDVLGRPFREFIDEASVDAANEEWTRLASEPGRTKTQRLDLRHRDGSVRPFEVSSVAVVRDGQVENVYGIARDIAERERLEAELRESEERYRFLVENSPDVIYATNADGQITYFSESVERVLGWTPSEVVGRHFRDIVRTASGAPVGTRFAELARGMPDLTTRMELQDSAGAYRPFEVTAAAIRRDGVFAGVHGSARDIGERERLERELRDSEERYRYLVQSSPDLVWMTDDEGCFTFVSDQARTILGWEPEELLGRSFADLAPPEGRRGAVARFRYLQRRPTEAHRSRLKVLSRDGRELSMEITGIGMVGDGRFLGAHGAARDVSERDRLERDLRRQAAELASSEERAHLARELHDSVTQALFSMTLLSRSAELLLQKDPAQVPEKLAALRELQRDALAEMRALIFELRPGNIEENGLIQALRTHSAALSGRIGLPVVVESDLPDRPPIEVEETLYRIAQEALHNVVKHAGARQVTLDVGRVAEGVRLRVVDDGRGFDQATVPDGHLGLAGMRSRAERLGGRLVVTSAVGGGTTIEVIVPDPAPGPATSAADALDAVADA